MQRPFPPHSLCEALDSAFARAQEVEEWLWETILVPDGLLYNPDHQHLQLARIGVLWTNVSNAKAGRSVVGTAEIPKPTQGNKWQKARLEFQLIQWFGAVPHFLITLDARYAEAVDDTSFCALVEHELYHCAQALDPFGSPKFTKDGDPVWTMRGHDVEEFVGVVRRYGMTGAGVRELVDAANQMPSVARSAIQGACGTCGARV